MYVSVGLQVLKRVALSLVLGIGTGLAQSAGAQQNADLPGTVFVLDASGSMEGSIDGLSKAQLARDAATAMVRKMAAQGKPVGLVSFGDQSATCQSARIAVRMDSNAEGQVIDALQNITPQYRAQTPLLDALQLAAAQAGPDGHVIAITDGIDTCLLNPCDLPDAYFKAKTSLVLIGLDIAPEEESDLECLAEAASGTYLSAQSQLELLTYSEVTPALINVSSTLRESRAEALKGNQDASAELRTLRIERDRALARATEMRNRQAALVGLIDSIKLELAEALDRQELSAAELVSLRQQYTDLEDQNARRMAEIEALEESLVASMTQYDGLFDTCEARNASLDQCHIDLDDLGQQLETAQEDLELREFAFSEAFLIAEDERLSLVEQLKAARDEKLTAERIRDLAQKSLETRNTAFSDFATSLVTLRKSEEASRLDSAEDQRRRVEAEAKLNDTLRALEREESTIESQRAALEAQQNEIETLKSELEVLQSERVLLAKNIDGLKTQIEEQALNHSRSTSELRTAYDSQLASILNESRSTEARLSQERDTLRESLEADKAALLATVEETRRAAEETANRLEKEVARLAQNLASVTAEAEQSNSSKDAQIETLTSDLNQTRLVLEQVRQDQSRLRALLAKQDPSYSEITSALRAANRNLSRCESTLLTQTVSQDLLETQIKEGQAAINVLEMDLSEQDLLITNLIDQQLACALPSIQAAG